MAPLPVPGEGAAARAVDLARQHRNGDVIGVLTGPENRTPVPLDELPDHLALAVLATEDQAFTDGDSFENGHQPDPSPTNPQRRHENAEVHRPWSG